MFKVGDTVRCLDNKTLPLGPVIKIDGHQIWVNYEGKELWSTPENLEHVFQLHDPLFTLEEITAYAF